MPAAQAPAQPFAPTGQPAPSAPTPAPIPRIQAPVADSSAVRRVVLPPMEAPATPAAAGPAVQTATPAGGQALWTPAGAGFDASRAAAPAARPAVPATAGTPTAIPVGSPGFTPGGAYQPVISPSSRPLGRPEGAGANGSPHVGQPAFVPAGQAPPIGQPFGTVALPNRDADATAIQSYGIAPAGPAFAPAAPSRPAPAPSPVAPTPASSASSAVADEAEPRWGSVGWKPAPSAQAAPTTPDAVGDEEPEEEVARHPYTWLHMIVLVVVAFILGMLIFMVIMQDDSPDAGAGAAPAAVSTVDPSSERADA